MSLGSELRCKEEALRERVADLRNQAEGNPSFLKGLATASKDLAEYLTSLGRREEALAVLQECIVAYRVLAASNISFQPHLIAVLGASEQLLSDLDRKEDMLVPLRGRIAVYRVMAAEFHAWGSYHDALYRALGELVGCLSALGRKEEALAVLQECIKLAEDHPAFQYDLAGAFTSLETQLFEFGRKEEAMVLLRRRANLAKDNASPAEDLDFGFSGLAASLLALGRQAEALEVLQEQAAFQRELARDNPSFRKGLTRALADLSGHFLQLSRKEEILQWLREQVSACHKLVGDGGFDFVGDLVSAYHVLSHCLGDLGRQEEASGLLIERELIFSSLAKKHAKFWSDGSDALGVLTYRLCTQGCVDKALEVLRERIALNKSHEIPDHSLPHDFEFVADRFSIVGRKEEAVVLLQERIGVDDSIFQRNRARAFESLHVLLSDLGRHEEAMAALRKRIDFPEGHQSKRGPFPGRRSASQTDLPSMFKVLASRSSGLVQYDEALKALRDRIVRAQAGTSNLEYYRAAEGLASYLFELDRKDDALGVVELVVKEWRAHVERNAMYNTVLAEALKLLSWHLSDLGRQQDALAAAEEVAQLTPWARIQPDSKFGRVVRAQLSASPDPSLYPNLRRYMQRWETAKSTRSGI